MKHWILLKREDLFNLPNLITISRAVLSVCLLIIFLITRKINVLFLVVLLVSSISDKVDGFIARKLNKCTNIGKVIDPIADKLFFINNITIIYILDLVPLWAVIYMALKDIAITLYRYLKFTGGEVVPSFKLGKYKTLYNMVIIGCIHLVLFLFNGTFSETEIHWLKIIVLTVII